MARFNEGIENNELTTVNDAPKNPEPSEEAKEQDSHELEQPETQQPQNYGSQKKTDSGKSEKDSLDNQELENNQENNDKQEDIDKNRTLKQTNHEPEQVEITQPQNNGSQKKIDTGISDKDSLENQELENNQEKDTKQENINENQPVPEVKKHDDDVQLPKQPQTVPDEGKSVEDGSPNHLDSKELESKESDAGNNGNENLTNQENATKEDLNNKQLENTSLVSEKANPKELVQLEEDPKLFDGVREINKPYYDSARPPRQCGIVFGRSVQPGGQYG